MNQPADAPYVYFVRLWIDPKIEAELFAWLDTGGHTLDVISQPGFLWAKRYRLEQDAPDGWHAYVIIYGLDAKASLETYFKNPIHEKFARERVRFDTRMRSERMWGGLEAVTLSPNLSPNPR